MVGAVTADYGRNSCFQVRFVSLLPVGLLLDKLHSILSHKRISVRNEIETYEQGRKKSLLRHGIGGKEGIVAFRKSTVKCRSMLSRRAVTKGHASVSCCVLS